MWRLQKVKTLNWLTFTPLASKELNSLVLRLDPERAIRRVKPANWELVTTLEKTFLPNYIRHIDRDIYATLEHYGILVEKKGLIVWRQNEWMLEEFKDWAEPKLIEELHIVRRLIYNNPGMRLDALYATAMRWNVRDIDIALDALREYHNLAKVRYRNGTHVFLPFKRARISSLRNVIRSLLGIKTPLNPVELAFKLGVNRPYEMRQTTLFEFIPLTRGVHTCSNVGVAIGLLRRKI